MYLLEAMACGVPVVQPDYGAFPEMIQRTGGGVLARSERPADIADALHALWRDPARAASLGERGAQGVRDHYSVDHMADRMLEVYRELVDNRAGRIPSHQELSVAGR
jgi:glycosyltransferase involved in cell wall biosynthesis